MLKIVICVALMPATRAIDISLVLDVFATRNWPRTIVFVISLPSVRSSRNRWWEPSAGLSPKNAGALYTIVERIRQTGLTLLLIEQNIKLGLAAAQTGLLPVAGQVRLTMPADQLLARQDLHQLYLGSA